jgi:integrase
MSSLHRHKKSPFWYCFYRTENGKQHFKSTGTTNKAVARIICDKLGKVAKLSRKKQCTTDRVRRLIEAAMTEVLEESGQVLPRSTVRDFLTSWLKEKEDAGAETTYQRYQGIVEKFLAFLGHRADGSLNDLTKGDILTFRDELAEQVTAGTVNTYLKVLRVALGRAIKEELLKTNPANLVDCIANRDCHGRRAFTLQELKKLLENANEEWRTMILVGLYTGLRLQDVANLTWENLDLSAGELTVTTGKTGRTVIVPLAKPLLRHIGTLPAGDDPKAALCPNLESKGSGWLSTQFYNLMASAGLVPARDHQARKHGNSKARGKRRALNEISFHCLRHTATSLLKNAGVSDVIARDIIGHESEAISRNYTHIETETKRRALDSMPDVIHRSEQLKLGLSK